MITPDSSIYTNQAQDKANKLTTLQIRRASLYDNLLSKSDMAKVRILPDMVGYTEDELPNYSYFNTTEVIKGVSEKDCQSIDIATKVWVICTEDFLVGWIMSEANDQYNIGDTKINDAWGFNKFKEHLLRCHLNTDSADYGELKVNFSNVKTVSAYTEAGITKKGSRATAVGLDVVNVRTGERFWLLQSGTTFAFTQDQIYMRVGSPDKKFSYLRMQAGSLEIAADNIIIYGRQKTSLGKHGYQVCGMIGPVNAIQGSPLIPIQDITC